MLRKLSPIDPEFEAILQFHRIWLQRAADSTAFSTSFGQSRLREMKAMEIKETLRMQRSRQSGVRRTKREGGG
jgi:hypothetical protein